MDLLGSSDEDEQVSFKINENYAKNYDGWRKKEERQKLIDRYGDVSSSDSSSEEEEIRSTPQLDKDWLRAFAVVRFQQPRLYKKGEKFFHDEVKPVVKRKEKATTLKDHERKFILEKGGVESDDETKPVQPQGKSYFEEQEEIKNSFKDAVADSSDDDDDDGGGENSGLLMRRQKTTEEQKKEENEYLEWIKGERDELDDKEAAAELAPLKEYWNNPGLSENERVLRDYILNNGYMDQEDSETEKEEEEEQDDGGDAADPSNFDVEEEFLEKAEKYEHKYNFRHEEPGCDEIKSYPRVIETSVRTKDNRRADQRKRKMDKKKSEREQRREEIRLLQKLQREEKMEKLEILRKIANNPDLEYDLEADFDPEEHNRIMKKFFNDNYYVDADDAGKKPTFEYDPAVDDEPDDWWQSRLKEESPDKATVEADHDSKQRNGQVKLADDDDDHVEEEYEDDANFIMDADYDPNIDYTSQKKKNKKSKRKLEKLKKLPLFDPTTKTFDEYMDEYLKDKIDKLPFTYREVVPNDFGLSTEEILEANEKELNAWVSVKKMSVFRSKHEELADKRRFTPHSTNPEKKRKILPSLYQNSGEPSTDQDLEKKKKKRKKKKVNAEIASSSSQKPDELTETSSEITTEKVLTIDGQTSEKLAVKSKKRKLSETTTDPQENAHAINIKDTKEPQILKKKMKKKHNSILEIKKAGSQLKELVSEKITSEKQIDTISIKDSTEPQSLKQKKNNKKQKGITEVKKVDSEMKELASENRNSEKQIDTINIKNSTEPQSLTKKKKKIQKNIKEIKKADSELKELATANINIEKQIDKVNAITEKVVAKNVLLSANKSNKNKKLKQAMNDAEQAMNDAEQDQVPLNAQDVKKIVKKHKKKKLSISNFGSKIGSGIEAQQTVDKRELKRQLMKVMSASRLSKYGIGPNAAKKAGGKKRKRKQKVQS